jgi:alpha-beta hydrolase superfamily lysophospholipase
VFLRSGFSVYPVDRPGLGRSPFHPDVAAVITDWIVKHTEESTR